MHIPVLMLSAKTDLEDKIKASEHFSEEYISKPFDLYELKERIDIVLSRRELLIVE